MVEVGELRQRIHENISLVQVLLIQVVVEGEVGEEVEVVLRGVFGLRNMEVE